VAKEIEKTRTPEEQELHEKLKELSALEAELAQLVFKKWQLGLLLENIVWTACHA